MTSALTKFMTNAAVPVSSAALADALANTVDRSGGVNRGAAAGLTFLGFSGKRGVYSLGKNKEDLKEDDSRLFLVEPAATIEGWTCWKDQDAVSKHKWLSTEALQQPELVILEEELEDMGPFRDGSGDGWKQMLGIGLIELTNFEVPIEFSATAVSAKNGLNDLIEEASDRARKLEPDMPIIWLGREQFTAKGNTNWKPTFNVESWVTRDSVVLFSEGKMTQDELVNGKAPKKRGRRAK